MCNIFTCLIKNFSGMNQYWLGKREPGSANADTTADKKLMYLENWHDSDNTIQESLSLFSTINALTIISDLKVFSAQDTASCYCQQLISTRTSQSLEERTNRLFSGKLNSLLNTSPTGLCLKLIRIYPAPARKK
jgi:hypothetical protein